MKGVGWITTFSMDRYFQGAGKIEALRHLPSGAALFRAPCGA